MPVGIDLGGTKVAGVRMDDAGRVSAQHRIATPRDDYPGTLDAVAALVDHLDGSGVQPVGIGTPGSRVPGSDVMQNCNSEWLNGRPLLRDLAARLARPVRMANDADCFALSEARSGSGQGYRSVFGVILGTGVGGGLVVDGRLLTGPNASAGEWGHTPLPYFGDDAAADVEAADVAAGAAGAAGIGAAAFSEAQHADDSSDALESSLQPRICYCGRMNCIETFLCGPGLARTHESLWGGVRSPEEIAAADDPAARKTFALYCDMLARSLAQVINIVDPHVIVLGGGLSNIAALYGEVRMRLARYTFSERCRTPVVPPAGGDASGVLGAAWLWLDS